MLLITDYILIVMIIIAGYILFPIKYNNLFYMILRRKDFVICHIIRTATKKEEIIYTVPNLKQDFQTKVWKNKTYNLKERYGKLLFGRIHFFLIEDMNNPIIFETCKVVDSENVITFMKGRVIFNADSIEMKYTPTTNEKIVIFADEVTSGLKNVAQLKIYGSSQNIALILAGLAVIISLATAYYMYQNVQELGMMTKVIYSKITPNNISVFVGK